jgi:hypothetical protein
MPAPGLPRQTFPESAGRFTVDRLMSIINRLGSRIEVAVKVKRSTAVQHTPTI